MYFTGSLAVDPSQITAIKVLKPTKVFGKILHLMTGGATSEKEEQETFTAVAILQQFNMALRSMGINNLVRLTKDDFDFYFDEEGKEDDLKEIMENFSLETDKIESEVFET
ncbi:MAG TPA: hypothetical protein ENI73_02335, partial [Spirochaetes bacterium]|nr:hypothetical protein [Spirochaetota bacterium]